MPDHNSVEKRTRSQVTLPDSVLHLNRSPLKEARTTYRNVIDKSGEDGGDESEEDELLLSPKKSTKRALSPSAPYTLVTNPQGGRSRYKRFKSEFDARFEELENEKHGLEELTHRPSHSRHASEPSVVGKKSRKRSATPSNSQKPISSSSSSSQPTFPKPRARSVPLFTGPTIDLRNPPASPTRARSRSPSKPEPKLAITPGPFKRPLELQPIPDESELVMDVDSTPIPRNTNVLLGFDQEKPLIEEATPRPTTPTKSASSHIDMPRISSPTPGPSTDTPPSDPTTPAHSIAYSVPVSPLTPLPETPHPRKNNKEFEDEDRYESTQGWGSNLGSVLQESQPTSEATDIALEFDAPAPEEVHEPTPKQNKPNPTKAAVNGKAKPTTSRVPLSRNTKSKVNDSTGPSTSTIGPPPTAASTSKSVARQVVEPKASAFDVLMGKKPLPVKNRATGKKTATSALPEQDVTVIEEGKVQKGKGKGKQLATATGPKQESSLLQKAKSKEAATSNIKLPAVRSAKDRMKPRTKLADEKVPVRFDDSEDEAPDKAEAFAVPRPFSPHPHKANIGNGRVVSLESDVEKVPSSPLSSLFDEDGLSETASDQRVVEEEQGKIAGFGGDIPATADDVATPQRASSLFSQDDDSLATPKPISLDQSNIEPIQDTERRPEPDADLPKPDGATDVPNEPQPMAIDASVQSPTDHDTPEQIAGKGKAKRAPRKKVAVLPTRRSARSASSKHNGPDSPSTSTPPTARPRGRTNASRSNQSTPSKPKQSEESVPEPPATTPSQVDKGKAPEVPVPVSLPEAVSLPDPDSFSDPFGGSLSELSSAPATDTELDLDEPEEPAKTTSSTASAKSGIPVAKKLAPSASLARPTRSSIAKTVPPKTPTKSRSSSPSKLPRPSAPFANGTEASRPTLAVAGSSYATLENALQKLRAPPPSRPSTSMGFNRDLDDDGDVDMRSKDDASRSALGIGRPSSSASGSSSKSGIPLFKAPAAVQKQRIFMPAGTITGQKRPAVMRGGRGGKTGGLVQGTIHFGVRGQRASQRTTLDTVVGSPVKGGTTTSTNDDVEMGEPHAESSNEQGDLTMADLTMDANVSNGDISMEDSATEGSTNGKAKKDKMRRPSMAAMAFQNLSQSLNDLSTIKNSDPATPSSPPRRAGLRSSSSTYPSSSSAGKKPEDDANSSPPKLSILSDCKVFIDYRSDDPLATETWTQMLKDLGARIMTRLGPTCTHILWKNGLPSTINRYRSLNDPKPHVIGNSWIVTCANESRRVDETDYLIDLEEFKFAAEAAAGHKRRKSMIPKLMANLGDEADTEDWGTPDGDVSMDSNTSISSDLTPLERARLRLSTRA